MPPFEYVPFNPAPYAASIGELLSRQHDPAARAAVATAQAAARAREIGGQAWGNAIQQVGQIPAQIMQQQRQAAESRQLGALRQSEIDQNAEATKGKQRAAQGLQLLGNLTKQYSAVDEMTGIPTVQHDLIANELTKAGYGDEAQKYLHTAASTEEDLAKINAGKRATNAAIGESIGKTALKSADPSDFLIRLDHLTLGGGIPEPIRQKFAQEIEQAGPEGWDALKQRYIQWGDTVAKQLTMKKDEKVMTGVSGTVLADTTDPNEGGYTINGQRFRRDGTKIGEPVAPQTPKSLEDQYLAAIAAGKQDAAALIRQTWEDKAKASRDPMAAAQLEAIRNLSAQEARARLDDRDAGSDKNQAKFEQEYRTVLARGLSSRSGGLGLEDSKVQQANHLLALLEQNYDPKTDTYALPKVLQGELSAGLARLVAPGGSVGIEMMREFEQRTAKGDVAGALSYITGHPFPSATQDIAKMLKDSIERQGAVALENREGEMRYLRGLAPTDLHEERRTKLEANSMNPLRQSRVAQDANGNRKVFVSLDGGKTWK